MHVVAPLEVSDLSPAQAFDKVLEEGVPWLASTDHPKVCLLFDALELHGRAKAAGSIQDQLRVMNFVRGLLSDLGFDPTSRARLGLAEVRAASLLDQLRGASGEKGPPK